MCVHVKKKAFFIEKGKKVVKSGVKNPAIFALMLINVKTPGNSDVNVTYGLRTDGLSAFLLSWNVLSMITYWPVVNVPFRSVPRSRLSRLIYRYPWYFLFRKRSYRQKSSRNSFRRAHLISREINLFRLYRIFVTQGQSEKKKKHRAHINTQTHALPSFPKPQTNIT